MVTLAVVSTRHICGGATRRAIIRSGWVGKTESAGTRDSRCAGRRACPIAEADLAGATARDTGTTLAGGAGITARDTGAVLACEALTGITGAGTIAGARLAGALTSSGVTVPATAWGFRVTVLTVRYTRSGQDIANSTQTEDAANGGGSDGFEGLAP